MSSVPATSDPSLPTFIVIGSMKSGTTSLASYLGAHPGVFMTTPKEPQYFCDPRNHQRGLEWYRSLFADGAHAAARGEASTHYSRALEYGGVPERMVSVVPNVRLLYLLREPIARIQSHYRSEAGRHGEKRPIDEAVTDDPRYLDTSSYAAQLERYLEHFDPSQVLVLWSDDLQARRTQTVAEALEFLGVVPDLDAIHGAVDREHNVTRRYRQPTPLHGPMRRVAKWTPLRWLDSETKRRLYRGTKLPAKAPPGVLGREARARLVAPLIADGERLAELIGKTPPWLAQLAVGADT
jgi:hypothetical protein